MLREIIILIGKQVIFKHEYGRTLSWEALSPILNSLIDFITADKHTEDLIDFMNIVNYRLAYLANPQFNLLLIFITDLTDKEEDIKNQIIIFKNSFIQSYSEYLEQNIVDGEYYKDTKYICDEIFKELRPKIALIGFSGVGKTTITKLIRAEDIPMTHVPTITGDVAAIKVGDLPMFCWDFAGQEQFSFIWSRFVKGSDAIILVVDSTKQNLRESKFFVDLIKKEAPKTRVAIVANKQDLPGALKPEEIANKLGYRTYPLIAIDPQQRSAMLNIIADVVEVTAGTTQLIQPMLERDKLMEVAEAAIMQGNILKASETYKRLGDLSMELGEENYAQYFYEQSKVLAQQLQAMAQKVMEKKPIEEMSYDNKIPERVEVLSNNEMEGQKEIETISGENKELITEPNVGETGSSGYKMPEMPEMPGTVPREDTSSPISSEVSPSLNISTPSPKKEIPPIQPTPAPIIDDNEKIPAMTEDRSFPDAQPSPAPAPTTISTPAPSTTESIPESNIEKSEIKAGETDVGTEEDEKAKIARLEDELKEINRKEEEMKANIGKYDPNEYKRLMMEYEDRKNTIHREIMDLRMEIIKKLTI
ncbi:MAG: ADP-ribosylation factor-like protein [Candidatus Helarchaeota archaeon]